MRFVVSRPEQLIVAVPYLLGFHPDSSLVVIPVGSSTGTGRIETVLRIDLTDLGQCSVGELVEPIARSARNVNAQECVMVAVGDGIDVDELPCASSVQAFADGLSEEGFSVGWSVFTPSITAGATWRSYREPWREGTLPDPKSTPLAAYATSLGRVVYDSRDELAARLTLASVEQRECVGDLVHARLEQLLRDAARDKNSVAKTCLADVDGAVMAALDGDLPHSDERMARLLAAVGVTSVRDAHLRPLDFDTGRQIEELWLHLRRVAAGPIADSLAVLIAASAYHRGDGTFATMALDTLHRQDLVARCLRAGLAAGLPPDSLWDDLAGLAAEARRHINGGDDVAP